MASTELSDYHDLRWSLAFTQHRDVLFYNCFELLHKLEAAGRLLGIRSAIHVTRISRSILQVLYTPQSSVILKASWAGTTEAKFTLTFIF